MTTERLLTILAKLVQDTSYDDVVLLERLNAGLLYAAGQVLLPDLVALNTVNTSVTNPYVDLPVDYHRELHFVASAMQHGEIPIETSAIRFLKKYPLLDLQGHVQQVSVVGKQLYYQGKPATADTLTLAYYRLPAPLNMNDLSAEPEGIPSHLHESLLVSYAAWKIYDDIEDALDGQPVNTKKHMGHYLAAIAELDEFVGAPDRAPRYIRDDQHSIGGYY